MDLMAQTIQSRAKRLIKLQISLIVFATSCFWDVMRRIAGRLTTCQCVVFYYHSLPTEQRGRFAHQMDLLVRWAQPIPADIRTPLLPNKRYAAVTFDDGFENVVENALPELRKRNIPATFFITSGSLGQYPSWWSNSANSERNERILSAEQLRELPGDIVLVGSHTLTHPFLPSLSRQEARKELSESRTQLRELLNREITLFSFPHGGFDEQLIQLCRQAGYERVFTTLPRLALQDSQEFVTGRVSVDPTDWDLEFLIKLLGGYRWLPFAFTLKRKLLRSSIMIGLGKLTKHTREQPDQVIANRN